MSLKISVLALTSLFITAACKEKSEVVTQAVAAEVSVIVPTSEAADFYEFLSSLALIAEEQPVTLRFTDDGKSTTLLVRTNNKEYDAGVQEPCYATVVVTPNGAGFGIDSDRSQSAEAFQENLELFVDAATAANDNPLLMVISTPDTPREHGLNVLHQMAEVGVAQILLIIDRPSPPPSTQRKIPAKPSSPPPSINR